MDTTAMVMLLILAVLIVILAFRYRDRIRFGLKGPLGAGLDFEGQDRATGTAGASESDARKSAHSAPARRMITTASGERSVAVGRDASGPIVTGDKNKVG